MVKDHYPNVEFKLTAIPGQTGCFEVTVNGQLIHSKKNGDGFVKDGEAFMKKVRTVVEGI